MSLLDLIEFRNCNQIFFLKMFQSRNICDFSRMFQVLILNYFNQYCQVYFTFCLYLKLEKWIDLKSFEEFKDLNLCDQI
jgi:hypothetical protein